MTDLTKIEKPFGKLDRETKIALFGAWLDGGEIQAKSRSGWVTEDRPGWKMGCYVYRVKPEPPTPDRIDWGHVADRFICMARDDAGYVCLYTVSAEVSEDQWVGNPAGFEAINAKAFASYRRGTCDWPDSLVWRPGYGPEKE